MNERKEKALAEVKFAFPRKATGLVRELGWWSAFSVSLSYTIGSGINYWVVQGSYWHPGSIIPVAYIIGALPAIFVAYVITEMGIMMPRSGGSYIYVSRVLDPHVGFLGDWLYFVANNFATGLLAVIGAGFWEKVINLLGVAMGNEAWAAFALDNMGLALIACVIITLYTLLSLLGIRIFKLYVAGLVAIGIVGSFLGIFATFYGVANPAYVKEAWNLTYGEGSWQQVEQVAIDNGWATFVEEGTAAAGGVGGATIGNFSDTFWAYWGTTAACYFGGEMKSPKRSFMLGVFVATLFVMIWYVLTAIGLYTAYGDFISQYCFVYGEGYADQVTAMRKVMDPSLPLFTVPLAHGMVWLQAIFAFIPAMWISNCAGSTLLVGPRQPFAWSFDKFFPDAFNRVNERFHSPHWSVILTAIIAYLFVPLSLPPRTFVATVDATFIFIISQLFIALAGVVVPYRRPDIWERGFKATFAGIPVISIVGALAVFFWAWGMAISASWLEFWGMLYLAFWIFIGSLIWFVYAERNRRMGIALQDIYGEIPPA